MSDRLKNYLKFLRQFNKAAAADLCDDDCYADELKEAFDALTLEEKDLILLSCNADVAEVIW